MNLDLMFHQHISGHTETRPLFNISSKRLGKWVIEPAVHGLLVHRIIHYTIATSSGEWLQCIVFAIYFKGNNFVAFLFIYFFFFACLDDKILSK